MPDYRCYPTTSSGSIAGPGQMTECVDDAAAIARAHELLPHQPFEVWLGARKVYVAKLIARDSHRFPSPGRGERSVLKKFTPR